MGQWNEAWNPFLELDPVWTDQFMATGASIYASGVMSSKLIELLSIAFDASYTHMYSPGTRRHIKPLCNLGRRWKRLWKCLSFAWFRVFRHATWACRSLRRKSRILGAVIPTGLSDSACTHLLGCKDFTSDTISDDSRGDSMASVEKT